MYELAYFYGRVEVLGGAGIEDVKLPADSARPPLRDIR